MKIDVALRNINRLFLDTGAVIYYVDANPNYIPLMDYVFDSFDTQTVRAAIKSN